MADYDYSLASEAIAGVGNPWQPLQVVRFHGHEAISKLFRYEITALAKGAAGEIDPRDLIGKRISLRIATRSIPAWKIVHGIIEEATDLDDVPEGSLLRIILVAPWARAMHRQRCRVFLDKTLRQIITTVLEDDPLMEHMKMGYVELDDGVAMYTPARERFTWRIQDTSRIDNVRARPFVVQYNESDFAFVSRLLEEEGIAYHFEHGSDACLLVLTDNDGGRTRLTPDLPLGPTLDGRKVDTIKLGARLRPTAVIIDDHEWRKPKLDMAVKAGDGADDLVEYHYPGSYLDAPGQGKPIADARFDRYRIEAKYAVGSGSVRLLGAGTVFKLMYDLGEHDGEYVVAALHVHGEQSGVVSLPSGASSVPWEARFELARRGFGTTIDESHFRPARTTQKPRIRGLQTAVVTADPGSSGAEVNVGGPDGISIGCVRVRFRWDTETERLAKEPSSLWVRVSQIFAGAGQGAVFHPRVGDEVLVDYDDGDPDRPVVVGRVYNGANLPMHKGAPTSSMKSLSTPGGGTYNEIMYEDSAGRELLHYYAGKDQTTDVANMRRESVVVNATMKVGGNNSETIGASRTESVGANDTLSIGINQDILIGANATTKIGGNFTHTVGANEANTVGVSQMIVVGGNVTETVGAAVTESYGASRRTAVGGAVTESFGAMMSVTVGGNVDEKCATHTLDVSAARLVAIGGNEKSTIGGSNTFTISGGLNDKSGGPQNLTVSGSITRNGPLHLVVAGHDEDIRTGHASAVGKDNVKSVVILRALGMTRDVTGLSISDIGKDLQAWGFKKDYSGTSLLLVGMGIMASGVDSEAGGPDIET